MKILAVDDERLALQLLTDSILHVLPDAEVFPCSKASEALTCAEENTFDIAFLDVRMRSMTGLELARKLKDIYPKINIIFVTGYNEYAGDAMRLHASGYIEKPITEDKVRQELQYLRNPIVEQTPHALLRITCLGNFEVFLPDGAPLHWGRSKSKECFAYLVSRCGSTCTVRELAGVLFEDEPYDRRQANYMQKIISVMVQTLKLAGAEKVLRKGFNKFSVMPEFLDCDYYRFRQGDVTAVNQYQGEFMRQYPWAEFTTGYLDQTTHQ